MMKRLFFSAVLAAIFLTRCSDYEYLEIPDNLPQIHFEAADLDKLNGKYIGSNLTENSHYGFLLGEETGWAFFYDYGDGDISGNSLQLQPEYFDSTKGQMVFKITEASGYYSNRTGQYLTLFARNISEDGSNAWIAIATRTGTNSIANSQGDILSSSIDEAKELYPPADDAMFDDNMSMYAHLWMQTTRTSE